ncbi:N-acetylmuramoyl-L-alanine amidase [Gracilibacillus orientalis]|uniref:N-acetylmuramoyl-L-alanine amidase n=1 Tax=Gracilibacillus orientalis TaxID=334253 RepID=A0A1I4JYI2_9BACI|nr:cell wall hydrolase [Gracilibacillus orientalis]SFL71639.1 N-acetylmuramoyl-L-alanine amidase [Gracilibacillus orientalis]
MRKIITNSVFILFIVFLFVGENTEVQAATTLEKGNSGQEVQDIQEKLFRMGYLNAEPTGYFGSLTERAVKDFQYETNLWVDGITGIKTRNQIDNVEMMARVVHGEARGESYEGMVAVAAVILNRKASIEFPNTIQRVIFQQNAFTAVQDDQYYLVPNTDAYHAVIDALDGYDPTNGTTYYYNPEKATDEWIFTRETVTQIGNHIFAE